MRSQILVVLLVFCCNAMFAQTKLSVKEAQELKERVIKTANGIETISSDFVQKKHLDFLENDIETFGKMAFKSPDMIKWEYTKPYEYSVVFKEDKLFVNDGGDKSKVNLGGNKLFQSLNDLIAKSVKGDMFDDMEFDIEYFKLKENYMVDFRPKRSELNTYIQAFQLTFDSKTAQVLEIKMIEPSDDYTRIIFMDRKINATLETGTFKN